MNRRSHFVLLICALGAIPATVGGKAQAAPLTASATAISAPKASLMNKTGQGCGWDYPCPPIPDYGRRFHRREGDVYIHNNYGEVNVYVRGGKPPDGMPRLPEVKPCDHGNDGAGACGVRRNCGGYPCDENCGLLCWMRRFKRGYCGHGCWAYLEQSRIAAEERAERREERREEREAKDEDLRGCYRGGCPALPYERPWREEAERSYERQHRERLPEDSLAPREPFVGPRYRGTCTDGEC